MNFQDNDAISYHIMLVDAKECFDFHFSAPKTYIDRLTCSMTLRWCYCITLASCIFVNVIKTSLSHHRTVCCGQFVIKTSSYVYTGIYVVVVFNWCSALVCFCISCPNVFLLANWWGNGVVCWHPFSVPWLSANNKSLWYRNVGTATFLHIIY